MCRSIKVLRDFEEPATPEEIEAAALQFVRKISGYRTFDAAVRDITKVSARLLDSLQPPANREKVSA
jgi:hypothetical protein